MRCKHYLAHTAAPLFNPAVEAVYPLDCKLLAAVRAHSLLVYVIVGFFLLLLVHVSPKSNLVEALVLKVTMPYRAFPTKESMTDLTKSFTY